MSDAANGQNRSIDSTASPPTVTDDPGPRHTLVLLQTGTDPSTRTFYSYESQTQAIHGLLVIAEAHFNPQHPSKHLGHPPHDPSYVPQPAHRDMFLDWLASVHDINVLSLDNESCQYEVKTPEWLKARIGRAAKTRMQQAQHHHPRGGAYQATRRIPTDLPSQPHLPPGPSNYPAQLQYPPAPPQHQHYSPFLDQTIPNPQQRYEGMDPRVRPQSRWVEQQPPYRSPSMPAPSPSMHPQHYPPTHDPSRHWQDPNWIPSAPPSPLYPHRQ